MRHLAHILVPILLVLNLLGMSGCNDKKGESPDAGNWPKTFLSGLSDTGKIGQVFCYTVDPVQYYADSQYKSEVQNLMKICPPGAVYLSSDLGRQSLNLLSEFDSVKLRGIISEIQNSIGSPCLFAGSFEHGAWYWSRKSTQFPPPIALAATGSANFAFHQGKITAVEAEGQGFNWILAPIVNNTLSFRGQLVSNQCFGSDPARIGEFVAQFVKGVQDGETAVCLKYYPGPEMDKENSPGSEPLKAGIAAGALSILCNPFSIASDSLSDSPPVNANRDILSTEFGFKGLVAREVSGVSDTTLSWMGKAEDILKSFARGQDMIILPDDLDSILPLMTQIVSLVQLKQVDIAAFQPSVKKVVLLKDKLNLRQAVKTSDMITSGVGIPEYARTSEDISRASITLLKNDSGIIPLDIRNKRILFANFIDSASSSLGIEFSDNLSQKYPDIFQINVLKASDTRIAIELLRRIAETNIIVCTFFLDPGKDGQSPRFSPAQIEMLHKISRTGKPCIGVSFCSPFLVNDIPEFKAFLTTYSLYPFALVSIGDVLFGKAGVSGKLPLTVSARYPMGSGLTIGAGPQSGKSAETALPVVPEPRHLPR